MLRRDKALLENLTRKYNKKTIISNIKESYEDIVFVDIVDYDYIKGKDFEIVSIDIPNWSGDVYDMIDKLKNGQAFKYRNYTYIFKDKGRVYQCYRDDTNNCWEI